MNSSFAIFLDSGSRPTPYQVRGRPSIEYEAGLHGSPGMTVLSNRDTVSPSMDADWRATGIGDQTLDVK